MAGPDPARRQPVKVGVLTFHRCINYGSYWQARCLVEALRARGFEAVLLDHDAARVKRAEWRCALQPLLPERTPRSALPLYARKARRFFRAFERLPLSARFDLDDPAAMEPCDAVVVGSDEVWNFNHPWYAACPLFFGEGLRARRVLSYAASFGNYDAAAGLPTDWAGRLQGFAALSVRDDNSRDLVRSATGRDPAVVLDPCLQFDLPKPPPGVRRPSAYVAVYGHSFPTGFAGAVRAWAAARGVRLVSIGYHNAWADEQLVDLGPEDFARLMAGAAGVATNFFHGCVFALAYDKPFACATTPYRSNKVRALTGMLGAQDRLAGEDATPGAIAELLEEPLDPAIAQRIGQLRLQSAAYLDAALA
jgi:hypothetical protein